MAPRTAKKAPAGAYPVCGLPPLHPGEFFQKETLPGLGLSKTKAAEDMGIGRQTLYDFMNGSALTPEMALRIGKLSGTDPVFWMNLQVQYDLRTARETLAEVLDAIPTHKPKAAA
jgi:addiction module HigA family antidote